MRRRLIVFIPVLVLTLTVLTVQGRSIWYPIAAKFMSKKTVDDVIRQYGSDAKRSLTPSFESSGVTYPPAKLALVAFKNTAELHVWAANQDNQYVRIKTYPNQAASGELGPKLREGDRQVPEGLYKISSFNPNSAYHLSMKINYPNEFDLKHANAEGREQPGSNIFIHGKAVSIGCLAMGDEAIEELFTLVHDVGRQHTQVIISPVDPSIQKLVVPRDAPEWTSDLYRNIEHAYAQIDPSYQR